MKTDPAAPVSILLVDDNLHGLTARRMILQELGHHVEAAESGEEGWELFQKGSYDLVVTDYRMGEMNGLELIRLIRASDSPARIILLTGFTGCLSMSHGADEVIAKSSKEVPELLRAVKRFGHQAPRRKPASRVRAARVLKTGLA